MTQYTLFCTKTIYYFDRIAFQKGTYYSVTFVHDLVQVKGEISFLQIEHYQKDPWFSSHFQLLEQKPQKNDRLIS